MNTDEKNLGERLELIRKSEKLSRSKFGFKGWQKRRCYI